MNRIDILTALALSFGVPTSADSQTAASNPTTAPGVTSPAEKGGPRRWQVSTTTTLDVRETPSSSATVVGDATDGTQYSNLGCAGTATWLLRDSSDLADRYVTDEATTTDITVTMTATGTVQPRNRVEISSKLSGTILDVAVDYNEAVEKGQVLAQLDTTRLEAVVEHARATVLSRVAQITEADASLDEANQRHTRAIEALRHE